MALCGCSARNTLKPPNLWVKICLMAKCVRSLELRWPSCLVNRFHTMTKFGGERTLFESAFQKQKQLQSVPSFLIFQNLNAKRREFLGMIFQCDLSKKLPNRKIFESPLNFWTLLSVSQQDISSILVRFCAILLFPFLDCSKSDLDLAEKWNSIGIALTIARSSKFVCVTFSPTRFWVARLRETNYNDFCWIVWLGVLQTGNTSRSESEVQMINAQVLA